MSRLPRSARLALLGLAALAPAAAAALPSARRLDALADATTASTERGSPEVAQLAVEAARLRDKDIPLVDEAERVVGLRVPTQDSRADRLLLVARAAASAGVVVRSSEELRLARPSEGRFALAGMSVAAVGDFGSVAAFVDAIETGDRLTQVESAELVRDAAIASRISVKLVLRFPVGVPAVDAGSEDEDTPGGDSDDAAEGGGG